MGITAVRLNRGRDYSVWDGFLPAARTALDMLFARF